MRRLTQWADVWSDQDVAAADRFERDLFGTTRRGSRGAPASVRRPWDARESDEAVAEPIAQPAASSPSPVAAAAAGTAAGAAAATVPTAAAAVATGMAAAAAVPASATSVVLRRAHVRLPTLGEEFDVAKVLDTATDTPATRATTGAGHPVDAQTKITEEARAHLRRHRQIHPALSAMMSRARAGDRLRVAVWLYVSEDLFDKGSMLREGPPQARPLVASSETAIIGPPERPGGREPGSPPDPGPDDRMVAYRRQVTAVVEQAARELPAATGVRVLDRPGAVPSLVVEATAAQIRAMSARSEVAGLFFYDPRGFDDLTDSMRIARATPIVGAGWRGTNIRVSLWEQGPDVLTDLRIEEFFDPAQANTSNHARLTTAVIKNRQSGGPHGYAPDCKIYSANSYDIKALNWAVVTKRCRVINQSFHRDAEQTSSVMSFDDLVKDYFATHYPYPTIVHAAGNQTPTANTEYVNHKGYNSVTVGNHDDSARRIDPTSVFRNPTSTHQDRELPELCANGDNVSAAGVTMSGTSFASPAVAGSVALLQNAANTLFNWPEGCRAILLAAAGRNVKGSTWWDDVNHRVDGRDGAGALDTREGVYIAQARNARNSPATRRGWDVGTLYSADFDAKGKTTFRHQVVVPAGESRKPVRVALAWSSKVTYEDDPTQTPPIKNVKSTLTVDLDLQVYEGTRLVAWSSSFDNSYEIVDFLGTPGTTYDIVIRRWSGTDWVWYGIAWTVL